MKIKLQIALFLSSILALPLSAQVSAYKFTQSMSNYTNSFTGPYLGYAYQDDTVNTFSIPFTFTFDGNPYTSVNLSSNGFISFNPISPTEYFPISSGATQNVISAFGQNLQSGIWIRANLTLGSNSLTAVSLPSGYSVGDSIIDWGNDFSAPYPKIVNIAGNTIVLNANALVNSTAYDIHINNGCIRTMLSGSTPTRVIEFEYQNFSRVNVFNEYVNFKIKLYETYNRVAVVYGPAVPGSSITTSQIGIKGSSTSDFNSRKVTGTDTYITSQTATVVTDGCEVSPSKMPSGGINYAWQPSCAIPGFMVTHLSPTVCAGESVTLTATAAQTYSWIGIDTTAQVIVTPTANTQYKLRVRWGFCVDSVLLDQVVNPKPTVTVSKSSTPLCAGSSVTLTASGADSYSWTGQGTGSVIVVSPSTNTDYTLTGTTDGCNDIHIEPVTVASLPTLSIKQSHTISCMGSTVTLTGQGAVTYTWTHNNVKQAAISVNPQNVTTYTVSGTGANGCVNQATVTQQVQDCTGLSEADGGTGVTIFPNPFNSSITVQKENSSNAVIEIHDITGRLVVRKVTSSSIEIDTYAWPAGAYFVTIVSGSQKSIYKLIK